MSPSKASATPTSIRQRSSRELAITWADGVESVFDVRGLRLACGCASCVDEWTGDERIDADSVPEDVRPVSIESVGRYAIQIHWSDDHSTGIYPFERLRELGTPAAPAKPGD